jgi:hypothetical protein
MEDPCCPCGFGHLGRSFACRFGGECSCRHMATDGLLAGRPGHQRDQPTVWRSSDWIYSVFSRRAHGDVPCRRRVKAASVRKLYRFRASRRSQSDRRGICRDLYCRGKYGRLPCADLLAARMDRSRSDSLFRDQWDKPDDQNDARHIYANGAIHCGNPDI